ncbi:flavin reductase (NADPH) [Condylostylus longicornis]|uniref:flavin reductase (NADPH) n=1 Tax=Condylostylus longicornis TaxID=2530218 RepID=UPI00244DDDCB|nr:flavin reductase (NADPH) [Condylostylus longicornis]
MNKIAVIGGTGMTGQCVVDYAVKKGLKVRLMYRNISTVPEAFKTKQEIELVEGDATKLDNVKNLLNDVDGVCVILGTRNNLEPTTEMSTGTQNVVEAMKTLNLKKFSVIMSSFLFWEESKVPKQFEHINNEHKKMLEITKHSGLDFVAILPPHISDEPYTEVEITENKSPGRIVPKVNLAKFIVDSLDQPERYGKVWGIAKTA